MKTTGKILLLIIAIIILAVQCPDCPDHDPTICDSTIWHDSINWIEKDSTIYNYKDSTIYHHVTDTSYVNLDSCECDTIIPAPDEFIIYNKWDLEDHPISEDVNPYYFGELYRYYDLDKGSVVYEELDGEQTKVIKLENPPVIGYGWAFNIEVKVGPFEEIYFSYNFKFDTTWYTTEGGKLPGMGLSPRFIHQNQCPEPESGSQYMTLFKEGGTVMPYFYDHTPFNCWGGHYDYPPYGDADRYINYGNWNEITIRMVNTGIYELWLNGYKVNEMLNRRFGELPGFGEYIDMLIITHFYGGDTEEYRPPDTTYCSFDNFYVWKPQNPIVVGNNPYDRSYILKSPARIKNRELIVDKVITEEGQIYNSGYGSPYGECLDETWMIDAGEGNTVTFDYDYGLAARDYVICYNGNTLDSPLLKSDYGPASGSANVTSTGRYLYIRFSTDKTGDGASGLNGNTTFNYGE